MDIYDKLSYTPLIIIDSNCHEQNDNEEIIDFNNKLVEYMTVRLKQYGIETTYITPEDYYIPFSIRKFRINIAHSNHIKKESINYYTNQIVYINIFASNTAKVWGKEEKEIKIYHDNSEVSTNIAKRVKKTLDARYITKKKYDDVIPSIIEIELSYCDSCDNSYKTVIDTIILAYFTELGIAKEELIFLQENKALLVQIEMLKGKIKILENKIKKLNAIVDKLNKKSE